MNFPALLSTPGLVSTLLLWVSILVYTRSLSHPPHAQRTMLLVLPVLFLVGHVKMGHASGIVLPVLLDLLGYALCTWAVWRTAKLTVSTAVYCAVWVMITTYSAYEIWLLLCWVLDLNAAMAPVQLIEAQILFTVAFYLLIRFTVVPMLPLVEGFRIQPLQLGSALVLGLIFTVQFQALMRMYRGGQPFSSRYVFVTLLIQLYCPAILMGQNAAFGLSALGRELKTVNALYERQRSQYQTAKRNVQLINKRCHDLKMQLAAVRKSLPADFPEQDWSDALRAVNLLDHCSNTGNEVLDTVLTEKALDCETHSISINTVADGKALAFMEAADLYALFAGMLDSAIGLVANLEPPDSRQIDVTVVQRQGFAVIHLITPVPPEQAPAESVRKASPEYKVIEKIIRKYGGVLTQESPEEGCCFKIVLPLAQ